MPFSTYVLYSPQHDTIYIGHSSNVESRFSWHNSPSNKGWTKRYQPWILVHTEQYETKKEAMEREFGLKSGQGRQWIWDEIIRPLRDKTG